MAHITDLDSLRTIYGPASERAVAKQLDRLDQHCRDFIGLCPFLILASSGDDGLGDASPKGDGPGFVKVLDDTTIAIPDWPGNRRLDTLTNLLRNPGVGVIFLIPGVRETLRINGIAEIRDDLDLRERFVTRGKLPITVIVIRVNEAYLHCAKSIIRSKLWEPESVIDRSDLASANEIIRDHANVEVRLESEAEMLKRYDATLY